jgi:membrane fusion protein, multidrug efflux system
VESARAALRIAQLNSGYASVQAPISGRIGRALVTEGALVSAAEATQLAVIQQTNTVFLNFTQSATELQALRRAAGSRAQDTPVSVILDDGSVLPQKGKLLFSDVTVDPTSGQVLLRATVPNPDGLLLPGQYVRVRLSQKTLPSAILVPQQAVTRAETGDKVTVVGADNKPVPREVQVSGAHHGNWIVTGGLKAGERVMVEGFQKLMMAPPGTPVKAVAWTAPAAQPAAPAAATK